MLGVLIYSLYTTSPLPRISKRPIRILITIILGADFLTNQRLSWTRLERAAATSHSREEGMKMKIKYYHKLIFLKYFKIEMFLQNPLQRIYSKKIYFPNSWMWTLNLVNHIHEKAIYTFERPYFKVFQYIKYLTSHKKHIII